MGNPVYILFLSWLLFSLTACGGFTIFPEEGGDDTDGGDGGDDTSVEEENWSRGEGGEGGDFLLIEPETETSYYIHAPISYDPLKGTPLILFCHGGDLPGTFRDGIYSDPSGTGWVSLSDEKGFIFVAPFVTETGERHDWSFYEFDTLDYIFLHVEGLYNVDLDRISITGHSAGAFVTIYYTLYHDDNPLAAAGPVAGGLYPAYGDYPDPEPPYKTPFFVAHHPEDTIVDFEYSENLVDALTEHGHEVEFVTEFEAGGSGHGYDPDLSDMIWEFFTDHPRDG